MRHVFPLIAVTTIVVCLASPANAAVVRADCAPAYAQSGDAGHACPPKLGIANRKATHIAQSEEAKERRRLAKERRAERKALRELQRLQRQIDNKGKTYDPLGGNSGTSSGGG